MNGEQPTRQIDLFAPSTERVYTVSELTSRVRALLEERFALVRVVGELSAVSRASSGHVYFSLKDERASLPSVMFRSAVSRLGGLVPEEGTEVEVLGRLTLYEPRGRTQLVVEWLAPRGAGALGLKFLQLKAKLEQEGLFAPERKRPLPFLPQRIGVVTSPTGAAIHDILKVLGERFPSVPVLLCPVRVQGEGAAEEIARAVLRMGDGAHGEVLIVGRGGGSPEDLWAFNQEAVVRAIVASKVPVVSAVGHEVDLVLSDLAADVRAPTPTAAAELVVPDRRVLRRQLRQRLDGLRREASLRMATARRRLAETARRIRDPRLVLAAQRMRLDELSRVVTSALGRKLQAARRRAADVRVRLAARDPRARLGSYRARLEGMALRLRRSVGQDLERRRTALQGRQGALTGLSPLSVLARGYSLVTRKDGAVVRSHTQVAPRDPLQVQLHQGSLDATVDRVHPEKKAQE